MCVGGVAFILGCMSATVFLAGVFDNQPALGPPLFTIGRSSFYAPWSALQWAANWGDEYPKPFSVARLIVLVGLIVGFAIAAIVAKRPKSLPVFGKDAWAKFADVEASGLFASQGAVLGKFDGEMLCYEGVEHQILIGASRSGKGRGHVVPTLLTWSGSALILDVKGELDAGDSRHGFPGTSGHRATLGAVLRFAPTSANSNCFNPLLEVRKGANEVRDVQNIVEMIVGSSNDQRGAEQFWNNSAKIVITGVVLHVLYAEPAERKTFATVREKLRDLDRTCDEMRTTLHRLNPATSKPEVHLEVLHAAESYLAGEERLRSGIKATAESFFGVFADPIVVEKTSRSDFRVGDLMCADKPVTLYLQPPPSDAQRLMPLMRLVINQVARSLMEDQTHDAEGSEKKHRLLLMLDEFPQLGKLPFFEAMMGAMAGYGLKAYLVCQSLNHITRAYGRDSVILDNCHIVTAFAAADPETAKRIADMAGEVWEIRPQQSEQRPRSILGPRKGAITYREERRPLMLPADVRGLPGDVELIFVAGMKPLKAKKLRFDAELLLAKRLRPAAPLSAPLRQSHDWANVVPLGKLSREKKTITATGATRGARPNPRPVAAHAAQDDLFAVAARPAEETTSPPSSSPPNSGPKISEIALAGFRDAQPTPPPVLESENDDQPRRRARSTGV